MISLLEVARSLPMLDDDDNDDDDDDDNGDNYDDDEEEKEVDDDNFVGSGSFLPTLVSSSPS